MPRAERGTNKSLDNKMKAKGLQRLRWYCQVCEKQCRDENGFKCHTMTEAHLRQMLVVGESAGKYIHEYSERFKNDFVKLLSRRWGTQRVRANQFYQEYISDKTHAHMNASRWVTLTEFVKCLGREGIVHADETEKGWYIAWIDNSPLALSKQAANQAKERSDMDEEQRMRKLIDEQIAKAQFEKEQRAMAGDGDGADAVEPKDDEKILKREEGAAPLTLSLAGLSKKVEPTIPVAGPSTSTSNPAAGPTTNSLAKVNPLKANPLKRPAASLSNLLKGTPKEKDKTVAKAPVSELERIMADDKERQRRKGNVTWSGSRGYGAEGLQVKRQRA